MILFYYLALICGASAVDLKLDSYTYLQFTPHYMEAYQNFARAKNYIQKHLPQHVNERYITYIRDEDIAFGTLVAIVGGLVQDYTVNPKYYDPVDVIDDYQKYGRRYHRSVAAVTYNLIDEASEKVSPIKKLMESVCSKPPYFNCDEVVEAQVRSNPYEYYASARLFIHLGKISKNILQNQALFDRLISNHEVVPYFYLHANDRGIVRLIKRLSKTYLIMNRLVSLE